MGNKLSMQERTRIEAMITKKANVVRAALTAAVERKRSTVRAELAKKYTTRRTKLEAEILALRAKLEPLCEQLRTLDEELRNETTNRCADVIGTQREIEAQISAKIAEITVDLWAFTPEARALIDRVPTLTELKKDGLSKILPEEEIDRLLAEERG